MLLDKRQDFETFEGYFSFLTQFYVPSKIISPICMDGPKLYYRELRQCNFVPSYRPWPYLPFYLVDLDPKPSHVFKFTLRSAG